MNLWSIIDQYFSAYCFRWRKLIFKKNSEINCKNFNSNPWYSINFDKIFHNFDSSSVLERVTDVSFLYFSFLINLDFRNVTISLKEKKLHSSMQRQWSGCNVFPNVRGSIYISSYRRNFTWKLLSPLLFPKIVTKGLIFKRHCGNMKCASSSWTHYFSNC